MKTAYDIIIRPVITEQSMEATELKKYVFLVAESASVVIPDQEPKNIEATHKSAHSTAWSRNIRCRSLTQQLAAIKRAATKEILFPMIRFVVISICSPIHIDHLRLPRRGLRKPSSTSLRGGTGSVNMGTVEFL